MNNNLLDRIYHTCDYWIDDENYSAICRACLIETDQNAPEQDPLEDLYPVINLIDQNCLNFAEWLEGVKASDFGDDDGFSGVLAVLK